ncbi:MAG: hypothetical protein ACJ749_03140 [Flavisolibacter sp.]
MEFNCVIGGKEYHFKNIGIKTWLVSQGHDSWIIYGKIERKVFRWTCADETLSKQLLDEFGHSIDAQLSGRRQPS